jgi:hypothetical protein
MRRNALLIVTLVIASVAAGRQKQGWQGDLQNATQNLHASLAVTWDSRYIWRGFDVFDGKSASHVLADVDLFETGFGLSVAGHLPNAGGFQDRERWDYTAYYQNDIFSDKSCATRFRFGWVYYNYPELNAGESIDLQEAHLILSWPSILPIQGLCPTYAVIKMWPASHENRLTDSADAWLHIFMLDYGFAIPHVIGRAKEHIIRLHSEIVYNDGFSPTPARVMNDWPRASLIRNPDHDWSNAVFGISTDLELTRNLTFTPAAYYQLTLNDTINPDHDELWASVGLRLAF